MSKTLGILLWLSVLLGGSAIVLIVVYATFNSSTHTSWEPFSSLILFVPVSCFGAVSMAIGRRVRGNMLPGACALMIGLAGVGLIFYLDRTDRLVQYERWLDRGMP